MAVAVDNTDAGATASAASATVSHTVTVSNVIVGMYGLQGTAAGHTFTMAYNGVSMTAVSGAAKEFTDGSGLIVYAGLFYLVGPSTGANNLTVTASAGGSPQAYVGGISLTGVDTSSPFGTATTAGGVKTTGSITVGTGGMAVGVCTGNTTSVANFTANQTEIWEKWASFTDVVACGGQYRTDTGVLSWTFADGGGDVAIAAAPINAAGSLGGPQNVLAWIMA